MIVPPVSAADISLFFTPRWHGQPIAIPSPAVMNDHGQAIRFTRLAALLSGFVLQRADGATVRLDGQYGLIDLSAGRAGFVLGGVPPGDYTGLSYSIGLPPAVNHSDPGMWPAGHPLNPIVDHLRWDWQGGYVFLALEGRWRESAGEPGDEQGFSYHLATDARVMPLRFISFFTVAGPMKVSFAVDLDRIVAAQRLSVDDGSESTHSGDGDKLAPRLGAAVGRAVFWLQAESTAVETGEPGAAGPALPRTGTALAFRVPPGFPQPALPSDNPLTVEGVALGRRLFTDRRLSTGGGQSCASCHAPDHAFSDSVALSLGVAGKPGKRNGMPLFNLAWSPAYTWDGGKPRVRDQALSAMTGPLEMNANLPTVVAALSRDPDVRTRFEAAFGTDEVTAVRIGLALEQYLLTIVSADSRFDRAARGQAVLTPEERRGFRLFVTEYDPARGRRGADCFHCHGGALFSDYEYRSNGLEMRSADPGRGGVTGQSYDAGRFKTPSLRNVALTAPYMHDGRFATLDDVVAHYDHGVRRGPNLDPNLAKHPAEGMHLGATDQKALVAFLRTLTDESLAERFR